MKIKNISLAISMLLDERIGNVAQDSLENGNNAEFQGNPEWIGGTPHPAYSASVVNIALSCHQTYVTGLLA
jgi:hypothetical protein